MMSHTPGPWSVEAIYALLRFGRKSGGSWDDIGEEHEFFPDENDANLIAAAPELLEALEAVEIAVTLGNAADDDPDAAREWLQAQTKAVELVEAVLKKVRGSNNGEEAGQ